MLPGSNYFRLAMVDLDSKTSYSQVIKLDSDCGTNIVVAPNPIKDKLTVRGLNAGSEITVFNASGQQVIKFNTINSVTELNTVKWAEGIYTLSIRKNGKLIKTTKLLKQ
jgi:hypothetical protein